MYLGCRESWLGSPRIFNFNPQRLWQKMRPGRDKNGLPDASLRGQAKQITVAASFQPYHSACDSILFSGLLVAPSAPLRCSALPLHHRTELVNLPKQTCSMIHQMHPVREVPRE